MLCCADPVLATDRHTCSTSLTARRQKRAKILGLKTWFQIPARNGLSWSQFFCGSLSSSSAAPLSIFSPSHLFNPLSFFKLLLPYSSCPYPPITIPQTSLLLPSMSPYISSLSFFQTLMGLFLLQVTFPSVSTVHCPCPVSQQTRRAGHLLSQASCLPPSSVPPPGIPLLPHHSTPQASTELKQRTDLALNQPTSLLQICSAPQSSQLVQNWPMQGQPKGSPRASFSDRQIYPQL